MIPEFRGQYRWLSNFWPVRVVQDEFEYPSVEHAYQAAKYPLGHYIRKHILLVSAAQAKALGKQAPRGPHFENHQACRLAIMRELLRQKFTRGSALGDMLITTGDEYIQEGNWWKDTYWGVYQGIGQNNLGHLIMEIRNDLHTDYPGDNHGSC